MRPHYIISICLDAGCLVEAYQIPANLDGANFSYWAEMKLNELLDRVAARKSVLVSHSVAVVNLP